MKATPDQIGMIALWRNDQYPYFLGGEISSVNERGMVETVEYGKGQLFKPVAVLPYEDGRLFLSHSIGFRKEYEKELQELSKKATVRIRGLALLFDVPFRG